MFEEIKEMICEYVEVDPDQITLESRFIEDLGFNSYDFMSMLGEIEERYEITVNEEDILGIHTIEEAIEYFESLKA